MVLLWNNCLQYSIQTWMHEFHNLNVQKIWQFMLWLWMPIDWLLTACYGTLIWIYINIRSIHLPQIRSSWNDFLFSLSITLQNIIDIHIQSYNTRIVDACCTYQAYCRLHEYHFLSLFTISLLIVNACYLFITLFMMDETIECLMTP